MRASEALVLALPFLAALGGCGAPGPVAVEARSPQQDARWMDEVRARMADAGRGFTPRDGEFVASVPERGLEGRFDLGGARLALGADTYSITTLGVGRAVIEAAPSPAPALGACASGLLDPEGRCVRRLEYVGAGVTEWWTSGPEGFEQGWTVEAQPDGAGPLTVYLEVIGAEATVERDTVHLRGDAGELLTVGALAAQDADGAPLDAWFAAEPAGFRIVVDDADARYPVEIDPVYGTATWTLAGSEDSGNFADSIAGIGDVDGDGYEDVAVVAANSDQCGLVYHGSAAGLETTARTTLGDVSACGNPVVGIGDVNGDGYDDVAYGNYLGTSLLGRVDVFLGSASGLGSTPATTLTGPSTNSYFGRRLAGAGDVDGDGYDDVVVSAEAYDGNRGYVAVYHGAAAGLGTTATTALYGAVGSARFGRAVAGVGDTNSDGYDDILVGAYGSGAAYVYYGSAAGITSASPTTLSESARFGLTVSAAGDVNADGYADVLVGNPQWDRTGADPGRVYLYLGGAGGVSSAAATVLQEDEEFGTAMVPAGDVDGDGYADVVVSSEYDFAETGRVYLYEGGATGLSTTASQTWDAAVRGDQFGAQLAAADVNGDGRDDLVVGAPVSGPGKVYVYPGTTAGLTAFPATTLEGWYAEYLGFSVLGIGDVDADGYDDVALTGDTTDSGSGRVYVYTGSAAGLSSTAALALGTATEPVGAFDAAGDVNGDGYDDLVVVVGGLGDPSVHVHQGSAAGLSATPDTTLSVVGSDTFGGGVAGAGDVNGDGYDDLLVGEYDYPTAATEYGRVHVFHGSATGVGTTAATTITGTDLGAHLGALVDGAGDVNGDGYDDVILGEPDYGGYHYGRLLVHHGSASGVSTSAATVLTGTTWEGYFGQVMGAAGDVDGDGYDDVFAASTWTASVELFHGSATGVATTSTSTLSGTVGWFANAVAGIGDVDMDGYDDLAIGDASYGSHEGEVLIHMGSATGVDATALITLTGPVDSGLGISVASAGDVDGDGDLDLLVGGYSDGGDVWLYEGWLTDGDGDGASGSADCDDTDPTTSAWHTLYADLDGDGYGDPDATQLGCDAAGSGWTTTDTDCDDGDAAIHPGATELCDASDADEDCNGLADNEDSGATGTMTAYADADGDGYGGAAAAVCDLPADYTADGTDCDDADATVHPGAAELCDAADVDENCDGLTDSADPSATGSNAFYADADGDGYGAGVASMSCDPLPGFVASGDDCEDADAAIHPGAAEICDAAGADEDCDGLVEDADPSVTGGTPYYADADGDGYGSATVATYCTAPSGWVADSTDCDDTAPDVSPGATEVCDAADVDEDCDTLVDDADPSVTGTSTWYVDADGDGYGSTTPGFACEQPAGYSALSDDCDDDHVRDAPGAVETVANGDDDDCDGGEICYEDADGDGYRGAGTVVSADADCADAGEALASVTRDCDDTDPAVTGSSVETVGDGVDEDCDGEELCYVDADGDGFHDGVTVASADLDCDDPGEAPDTSSAGDCDDADAAYHPGAEEDCSDLDDYNCDGSVGYVDGDGDGFWACEECNDAVATANPDGVEVCNGVDDDCEGTIDAGAADARTWSVDADGDGYTDPAVAVTACAAPDGYRQATEPDCDDADPDAYPGAVEVSDDGVDQDCDGADATGPDTGDSGGDTDDAEPEPPPGPGCGGAGADGAAAGCATGGASAPWLALVLAALVASRRRAA